MVRLFNRAASALVMVLVLATCVGATEYFVDFDGTPGVDCSDAGPGSDPRSGGTPWCTLPGTRHTQYYAGFLPGPWQRIHAGDTISIKAGSTHTSADGAGAVLVDHKHYDDGTATARIVIRKHPSWGSGGSYASFDGTGIPLKTTGLVTVYGTDYVTLDGLEVANSSDTGIDVELDAHHVVVDHAYVHHCDGTAMVLFSGCTTMPCMQVFRNSVVAYAPNAGGILIDDNPGGYVLIENNDVHHICARRTAIDAIQCGAYEHSTSYCAIRNNVIHDHAGASGYEGCAIGGSDPIGVAGAGCHHHALIEGNEAYDATGRLLIHAPYAYTCDQWGFESHNIVRRNRFTNIDLLTYYFPNDTIFYNNTFYNLDRENAFQAWTSEALPAPGTTFGTAAQSARANAIGRDVDYGRLTLKNNILWGNTRYHVLLNGVAGYRIDVRYSSLRFYYNLYRAFRPLYWYADDVTPDFTYYDTAAAFVGSHGPDAPDVGSIFSDAAPDTIFVDAAHRDYRLAPGSPAIGAGTAITHAVGASAGGSGSSTRLIVERASFTDGYGGLFEPDHITVGDCRDVAISRLDDRDAAIVLAMPCRWRDGDPVNLASQGTTPDLGAFEAGTAPTGFPTPRPTATAAPNVCGDGFVRGGEQCDDGNRADGDCCSATCTLAPAGTACDDDANACTTGSCDAEGTCHHESITCDACEACDPAVGCVAAPRHDCRESLKPDRDALQMTAGRHPSLKWVWATGAATTLADYGDPRGDARFALCVFGDAAPRPVLALRAEARTGLCGDKPCWKQPNASSFTYKDPSQTPDGLDSILLKSGTDGKAKISIIGKGPRLALPALPLAVPLRVQLQSDDGRCWESRHTADDVSRNRGGKFRATASPR